MRDGSLKATAVSFDILDDPLYQNLLTAAGWVHATVLALKIKIGGGALTAPVCSTWVWLSRFSTGRRLWCPLGSKHSKVVQDPLHLISSHSIKFGLGTLV